MLLPPGPALHLAEFGPDVEQIDQITGQCGQPQQAQHAERSCYEQPKHSDNRAGCGDSTPRALGLLVRCSKSIRPPRPGIDDGEDAEQGKSDREGEVDRVDDRLYERHAVQNTCGSPVPTSRCCKIVQLSSIFTWAPGGTTGGCSGMVVCSAVDGAGVSSPWEATSGSGAVGGDGVGP